MSVHSSSALVMAWLRNKLSATANSCRVLWMCSLQCCLVVNLDGGVMVMLLSLLDVGGSGLSCSMADILWIWKLFVEVFVVLVLRVLDEELIALVFVFFLFTTIHQFDPHPGTLNPLHQ